MTSGLADLAWATLTLAGAMGLGFHQGYTGQQLCLVDWGAEDRWVGGDEGNREVHPA